MCIILSNGTCNKIFIIIDIDVRDTICDAVKFFTTVKNNVSIATQNNKSPDSPSYHGNILLNLFSLFSSICYSIFYSSISYKFLYSSQLFINSICVPEAHILCLSTTKILSASTIVLNLCATIITVWSFDNSLITFLIFS